MASDRRRERAARLTVRRYESAAEAERDDAAYWLGLPETERVLYAWQLSRELWQLRGEPIHEPGLRRSVARVRRR
jgi:hypothetical protein